MWCACVRVPCRHLLCMGAHPHTHPPASKARVFTSHRSARPAVPPVSSPPPHAPHGPRWVQVQCRSIGEYDAPEVQPALQVGGWLVGCSWPAKTAAGAPCSCAVRRRRGLWAAPATNFAASLQCKGARAHICRLLVANSRRARRAWRDARTRCLTHTRCCVASWPQAAVAALRERPVLFKYCAEEVSSGGGGG